MKILNKRQKAMAQFLHGCYTSANKFSDAIDPKRSCANRFDGIASLAVAEFIAITDKHPSAVQFTDLAIKSFDAL